LLLLALAFYFISSRRSPDRLCGILPSR